MGLPLARIILFVLQSLFSYLLASHSSEQPSLILFVFVSFTFVFFYVFSFFIFFSLAYFYGLACFGVLSYRLPSITFALR